MAICLRRNFKSCSSFVFIGRRNPQANCVNEKPTTSDTPYFKEMAPLEYSPFNIFKNSRVVTNFQPFPESVYCAQECKAYKEEQKDPEPSPGKPGKDQLDHVSKVLVEDLPKLFVKSMNLSIYHQDIIFENNIKGTKTKGIFGYVKEISILKIVGHIKFANVQFKILKVTVHPEDGTVRLRWRITGISNYKAFFSFLKPLINDKVLEPEGWYDGFSIYFVKSDGLVHKHIVDKMIPDSDEKVSNLRNNLAAKMASIVGVTTKSFSSDLLYCQNAKLTENFKRLHRVPPPT